MLRYHQRALEVHQLISPEGHTDPAFFEQELDQLLSRFWSYARMTDDVAEPGDFMCVQAGRFPLVVVRGPGNQGVPRRRDGAKVRKYDDVLTANVMDFVSYQ